MVIDFYASEPHFASHLAPTWRALPAAARGSFFVAKAIAGHAARLGVDGVAVGWTRGEVPLPAGDGPTVVAGYGDLKRARIAGRTRLALAQHGAGQSYGADPKIARHHSYAGGEDCDDVTLFLVPNDHAAARFHQAYPAAAVEIVGSPVLDELPRGPSEPGPPALGWHWDCTLGTETASAFREYTSVLRSVARAFPGVLGHGHPRRRDLSSWYRGAGIEYVPDFVDVCARASVYVCDNSSTLFEFAATGRPVVVVNSRRYRPDREHGLRFWAAAGVGIQVDRPADLVDAIRRAVADPPEIAAARRAALELVYQPLAGGPALAAAALQRWA
jgi:hypothetical protein